MDVCGGKVGRGGSGSCGTLFDVRWTAALLLPKARWDVKGLESGAGLVVGRLLGFRVLG